MVSGQRRKQRKKTYKKNLQNKFSERDQTHTISDDDSYYEMEKITEKD